MKYTVLFIFLLSSSFLTAQKVGVNITSPEFTLDVRSTSISDASQINLSNPDNSRYVRFFSGSDAFPDPSMTWNPGHNFLFATFDDVTLDFTEKMRISSTGDVGIGLSDPQARLDVRGGDWNLDAGNPGDLRIGNSTYNLRIGVATGGGGAGISRIYSSNNLLLGVDNTATMTLDSDGETGFGTTNPSQKVHINGKLKIGDDATTPTEGTIRYNATSKSFEGHDGGEWIILGGSSPTYSIGLSAEQGGYIFWVSSDGKHGLVVETVDQSSASSWYEAQNIISDPGSHSANGNKFRDWRMPTKHELNEMYLQRVAIGGFSNVPYWSSTEFDYNGSWRKNFGSGDLSVNTKNVNNRLRAVRSF